jgi:hypothetical protein
MNYLLEKGRLRFAQGAVVIGREMQRDREGRMIQRKKQS